MIRTFDLSDAPQPPAQREERGRAPKRGRQRNALDGWIVLDKPVGLTSTQALAAVKRLINPDKAGHAGTLDPLASGMLPLAFGEATKTVPFVVDGAKSYRFTVRWGTATDTDDADGAVIATSHVRPSEAAIVAALPAFVGEVMQVPPRYSAVKIAGQRAYDIARAGDVVELKPRPVTITRLALISADADSAVLEADCGKGTYVRAIARDLAAMLATCAHVTELRRTRVGPFAEGDMITLDALTALAAVPQAAVDQAMRDPADALAGLPAFAVDRNGAGRLRRGQSVLIRPGERADGVLRATLGSELVALCAAEAGELRPLRVFKAARRTVAVPPRRAQPAEAAAEG